MLLSIYYTLAECFASRPYTRFLLVYRRRTRLARQTMAGVIACATVNRAVAGASSVCRFPLCLENELFK